MKNRWQIYNIGKRDLKEEFYALTGMHEFFRY